MAIQTEMDMIFGFLIAVGIPLASYISHRREIKLRATKEQSSRQEKYRSTLAMLWVPAVLLLAYWANAGRSFDLLGFAPAVGLSVLWGWAFVAVCVLFLCVQLWGVKTKETAARQMVKQMDAIPAAVEILPDTWSTYKSYALVALTAGITEEIMFRAFLLWFFSAWAPLWLAGILALIPFVLSHLYQEKLSALIQVAALGATFTLLYVLSGSVWPAIALHIIVDLVAGATYLLAKAHIEELESAAA